MKVKDLMKLLVSLPMGADVVVDIDDGMVGNYKEAKKVSESVNLAGESFIIIGVEL